MTKLSDSIASLAGPVHSTDRRWNFPVLFGMQTIGAGILFWNAVPLYQQVLADPAAHVTHNEHLIWALSSIALMQVGYWISYRLGPSPPPFTNALLGHVTLFLARMGFVFATSVFGFLIFAHKPGFQIPTSRYALALVGLFSLFCYVQELERLGRSLLGRDK